MGRHKAVLAVLVSLMAGCAGMPDHGVTRADGLATTRGAAPTLVPGPQMMAVIDEVRAGVAPDDAVAWAELGEEPPAAVLAERADALRARVARLRRPVMSADERARLAEARLTPRPTAQEIARP